MAAGQFSIPLRDDTPQSVLDLLDLAEAGFALVVVSAGDVSPEAGTGAQLTAQSRYTGVLRKVNDGALQGAGLQVLLGDEDDKGPRSIVASAGATDRTFKEWVELFDDPAVSLGSYNGLDYTGNVEDIAGDFKLVMRPGATARVWLDQICLQAGAEWRVRNNLTLHAGTVDYLYPDPRVVVTAESDSRESHIRGLRAVIATEYDVEDWTSDALAFYKAGGVDDGAMEVASLAVNPYVNPVGDPLVMARAIDANRTGNADNAESIAENDLAKTDDVRKVLSVQVDAFDIGRDVSPGDTVYVYDPPGLTGSTELSYRGRTIGVTTRRVWAVTWPVQQGMGVHLIVGGVDGDIHRLTDHVAFEGGMSTLEVGAPRRNLIKLARRGQAA